MADVNAILPKFKLSVGDLTPGEEMDEYYLNLLTMAKEQILSNDISETVLDSELGASAIILYAKALMNEKDVATDPTLILLINTLSAKTKGERYADGP